MDRDQFINLIFLCCCLLSLPLQAGAPSSSHRDTGLTRTVPELEQAFVDLDILFDDLGISGFCPTHVNGFKSTVTFSDGAFVVKVKLKDEPPPCDSSSDPAISLGQLRSGEYRVEVFWPDNGGGYAESPSFSYVLEVQRRDRQSGLNFSVNGFWNDNLDPGWSLSIEEVRSGIIFVAWLYYDTDGVSRWAILANPVRVSEGAIEGEFLSPVNGSPITRPAPALNPILPDFEHVGEARITFAEDGYHGLLEYWIDGVANYRPLLRVGPQY